VNTNARPCSTIRRVHLVAIDLAGRDAEVITDRCWQAGATGIWEVGGSSLRVGVDDARLDGLLSALGDLGARDVTGEEGVGLDGRSSNLTVGDRPLELWVPATVFGDGHHPTTAACLHLLERSVRPGGRVLDVGCGAGALSLASAVLGGDVLAIDADPEAVETTAANAERNELSVTTSRARLEDVGGHFDVVVANLTAGTLSDILPALLERTTSGGELVVSGIIEERWPEVGGRIPGPPVEVLAEQGWVTAAFRPAGR
jgi:SAM-dependent methyltransferase